MAMISEELSGPSERDLLIRIDTKLEGVIADKKDHEERIRKLEGSIQAVTDQVTKSVTPKQLWTGFAATVGVIAAGSPVFDWMVNR